MQQEETLRRNERERKALADRQAALERSLQAADSERRATQEKIGKMKASEAKQELEKRRLKDILDASESRSTKLELLRRSLEGELQRSKLVLSDREAEIQGLHDRIDVLQRQVTSPPQAILISLACSDCQRLLFAASERTVAGWEGKGFSFP
nr:rootletin-like [Zootoca vivipara]